MEEKKYAPAILKLELEEKEAEAHLHRNAGNKEAFEAGIKAEMMKRKIEHSLMDLKSKLKGRTEEVEQFLF